MRFEGKVALITAAASGIGKATAEIIAREGGTVVAIDNNQQRLDALLGALRGAGGKAEGHLIDALDEAQVDKVVAAVETAHKGVDILVNAVGGSTIVTRPNATVEELGFEDWQKLIAFNLSGTFLFTHAVVPIMKRQRGGKIVNLSFTRKLSLELGPYNINVNAIAPSLTLTERIRPYWDKRSQGQQAEEIERTPLRRIAEAVDQANVICFLASSHADFVTGVTIDVSGGLAVAGS